MNCLLKSNDKLITQVSLIITVSLFIYLYVVFSLFRYIENLRPESNSVSNWEKQLTATQENTPIPVNAKLPVQWLGNGAGHHETSTSALWALRDVMLKDALTVQRTLDWSEM